MVTDTYKNYKTKRNKIATQVRDPFSQSLIKKITAQNLENPIIINLDKT